MVAGAIGVRCVVRFQEAADPGGGMLLNPRSRRSGKGGAIIDVSKLRSLCHDNDVVMLRLPGIRKDHPAPCFRRLAGRSGPRGLVISQLVADDKEAVQFNSAAVLRWLDNNKPRGTS